MTIIPRWFKSNHFGAADILLSFLAATVLAATVTGLGFLSGILFYLISKHL